MAPTLQLHEELILLGLNDDKGTFTGSMLAFGVGGAMVSELLLQERIATSDDDENIVSVLNAGPTGDEVLDELLGMINSASKPRSLKDWVLAAGRIKELTHRIARRLAAAGIVEQDERKILWVFTQRIYPEVDGSHEDAIRARMARVMFDPATEPDERTAVLIAFASQTNLLAPNFVPMELKQHKSRIDDLAKGKILAAEATGKAIAAVQTAVMVATMVPAMVAVTASN